MTQRILPWGRRQEWEDGGTVLSECLSSLGAQSDSARQFQSETADMIKEEQMVLILYFQNVSFPPSFSCNFITPDFGGESTGFPSLILGLFPFAGPFLTAVVVIIADNG